MSLFRHPSTRQQRGFTLVELAIALVIIGLFLGGILRASEIIFIAKARRGMADVHSVEAAIKGFQDKYGSVPGDFAQASQQIPGCQAGNTNFCVNGNSDSMIGCTRVNCGYSNSGWDQDQTGSTMPMAETTQFWKHLALTHFIKGVNPSSNPDNPAWGETHPADPMGGGFEIFTDTEAAGSSISIRSQLNPRGANFSSGGPLTFLTGRQAQYLDEKYDDGKPGAGYYWAIPPAADGCRINGSTYNPALIDVKNSCAFHFILH